MKKRLSALLSAVLITGSASVSAQPSAVVAGYYDTRGIPTATITVTESEFPLGLRWYSFMDIATEQNNLDNVAPPYVEARLSRKSAFGAGVAGEYNRNFAQPEGTLRLGFIYEPDLSKVVDDLFLGIKAFPASSNNHGMQAALYGKKCFSDVGICVGGFFDYNAQPRIIVTEVQVEKSITRDFALVLEGRYNGFMGQHIAVALGLAWNF